MRVGKNMSFSVISTPNRVGMTSTYPALNLATAHTIIAASG